MLLQVPRGLSAAATALVVAGALSLGALSSPAEARPLAGAPQSADVAVIALEGVLLTAVVESDAAMVDGVAAAGDQADARVYAVRTGAGSTVSVEGKLPEGAQTGDGFSGAAVIPRAVLEQLTTEQAEALTSAPVPVAVDTPEALAAQDKAGELGVELPIAEARISPTAAAADGAVPHSLYLAIPTISGAGTSYTSSQASTVATTVANFWATQSEGVLEGFTIAGTRSYPSSLACSTDPFDRWDEAASAFGMNLNTFVDSTGKHLVVLLPAACDDEAAST
jgi:hypothetical protein